MNLVYDGSEFKTVKLLESKSYSLDDIDIFVSRKYANCKMFLIVRDNKNKVDTVELKQANSKNIQYYTYKAVMDTPLKFNEGACSVNLIGIDIDTSLIDFSTQPLNVNLVNEDYNFKAQIAQIEQFSKASAATYKKIYELYEKIIEITNLNIEMLKDSQEE